MVPFDDIKKVESLINGFSQQSSDGHVSNYIRLKTCGLST